MYCSVCRFFPVLAILTLLGSFGCDAQKTPMEVPVVAPIVAPAATTVAVPERAFALAAPTDFTLSLQPETPRVGDCLQAVINSASGDLVVKWDKNGEAIEGAGDMRLCEAKFFKGDTIGVTVSGAQGTHAATVTIANSPPKVSKIFWQPANPRRGLDVTATPSGVDADGDPIDFTYQWTINGVEVADGKGPVLSGNLFRGGDRIAVTVVANDGVESGRPYPTGEIIVANSPPKFVTTAPKSIVGSEYVYEARAEDPDGEVLSYRLETAPDGMTVAADTGRIQWSLSTATAGTFTVRLFAEDPSGAAAVQEFYLTLR